jgi:hypothetical protein
VPRTDTVVAGVETKLSTGQFYTFTEFRVTSWASKSTITVAHYANFGTRSTDPAFEAFLIILTCAFVGAAISWVLLQRPKLFAGRRILRRTTIAIVLTLVTLNVYGRIVSPIVEEALRTEGGVYCKSYYCLEWYQILGLLLTVTIWLVVFIYPWRAPLVHDKIGTFVKTTSLPAQCYRCSKHL